MKQEVKAEWVKALRSGEYQQGVTFLHAGNQFCCLGVLCDLAVKAGATPKARKKGTAFAYGPLGVGTGFTLPRDVQEWAGLTASDPIIPSRGSWGDRQTLAGINDEGSTFEEIANIIEEEF